MNWPPRLSLRVLRCPPRGPMRLRPGKAGSVALDGLKSKPPRLSLCVRLGISQEASHG